MAAGACVTTAPAFGLLAAPAGDDADAALEESVARHRPSRLKTLPAEFNARFGATHVAGKYHLTGKPFLIEGAEKLIELGTRLGKFWFEPDRMAADYPFNSQWAKYPTLLDLAKSDYWQQVFALPFATIFLEISARSERGWERDQPPAFYEAVTQEFQELTAWCYRQFHDRALTLVLQHWEGDWLLRGKAGEAWNQPPADWPKRCARMTRWLAARQAGVSQARAAATPGARCRVAHATEVNRVADIARGIPTLTDKVLPAVELDLVSYSAYDGMKNGVSLYKAIEIIRSHARTGPLFGPGAVCLGEMGIPENNHPAGVAERWDDLLGAALAARVLYVAQWELYCNELNPKLQPPPVPPVSQPDQVRGFWLVRPDGSLSQTGSYFRSLWQRASRGA